MDCLGSHTLALIQAGSFIRAKRCTLSDYPGIFQRKAQKLLEYDVIQEGSRYSNAWTTFEVTANALENPKAKYVDAKRLLDTLSMLHFTNFRIDVFEHTWKEARTIRQRENEANNSSGGNNVLLEGLTNTTRTAPLGRGKDAFRNVVRNCMQSVNPPNVYAQQVFKLLVEQVSDFLPTLEQEWESDRIHEAIDVLTNLALIQKSETKDRKITISMHKLTHSWARERMRDPQTKRQAWLRAGSIIVLSNITSWIWADPEIQLRTHARYFADTSRSFDISGVHPDMAEKIVVVCAELLQILREDVMLEQFLDKIIKELQKRGKLILEISLPLCKVKARNLYNLTKLEEAVEWWRAIVDRETKRLTTTTRSDRLESKHRLTEALFAQGQRNEAIEILRAVIEECKLRLKEEHPVRLAAEHDFADFNGLQGNREKAIELFKHVVEVRKRIYNKAQPELLASQHQLARTYLHKGEVNEAFHRFEYVLRIREEGLPEIHPERLATEHEIGCCYRDSGQLGEAIERLKKVVNIRKQTLTPGNTEGLLSQMELAQAYMLDKQWDEANEMLTHIVEIQKHLLKDNPQRQRGESMLLDCHAHIGDTGTWLSTEP